MAKEIEKVKVDVRKSDPAQDWQEQARIAAEQIASQMPSVEEAGSQEQAQQWLEQAEQESGE